MKVGILVDKLLVIEHFELKMDHRANLLVIFSFFQCRREEYDILYIFHKVVFDLVGQNLKKSACVLFPVQLQQ